jgi:hypothetical protein
MSSLRELCALVGLTEPGTRCSSSARAAKKRTIRMTRSKRAVKFDRIIALPEIEK